MTNALEEIEGLLCLARERAHIPIEQRSEVVVGTINSQKSSLSGRAGGGEST
jgi:hypothetical protein